MAFRTVPTRLVNYTTPAARKVVRAVLEPHPQLGLTSQEIHRDALAKFPDEEEDTPQRGMRQVAPGTRGRGGKLVQDIPEPPNINHPIRSMKYLKKVVLEELEKRGEIQQIHIKRGYKPNPGEVRMDTVTAAKGVKFKIPEFSMKDDQWRWRLVPGHVPEPFVPQIPLYKPAPMRWKDRVWEAPNMRDERRNFGSHKNKSDSSREAWSERSSKDLTREKGTARRGSGERELSEKDKPRTSWNAGAPDMWPNWGVPSSGR